MAIYQLGDHRPEVHHTAWVAESATVVGQVELAEGASVWYGAVLRGDNDRIRVGRHTNIQDGSVLHVDDGVPLTLGEGLVVGHQCSLHSCAIGDGTLVGLQAMVLNRARVGRRCIIAAGALIPEGREFPDEVLIVGAPAKVARPLRPEEIEHVARAAAHYMELAALHRDRSRRIDRCPS